MEKRKGARVSTAVELLLGLMLGCVHMEPGQPARGSELTAMRHRNGLLQDHIVPAVDGAVRNGVICI
jgi:hypothetical protein